MKKYFMFGLLIFLFPIIAHASTKQITCEYSSPSILGCDLQQVNFSFTVYDDKAEFNGFKNCSGGVENGHCHSSSYSGADIYLARGMENKFLDMAYNKTTKKYSCPNLSYSFAADMCVLSVNYGEGEGDNRYPLQANKTEHVANASYPHKLICSYNQMVGGIPGDVSFSIYYEGPSMYSLTVKHGGQTYSTSPSNMDLLTTFSNKTLRVPIQTLNSLYSDFNPNKAYGKCNAKKLYFNNYGDYYVLENKSNGNSDSNLDVEDDKKHDGDSTIIKPPGDDVADCDTLLGPTMTKYLKIGLTAIQIVGVILAIILSMGDFISSVMSGEADSNKKAFKKAMIRILIGAVLLIVPALLKFVINTVGVAENGMCIL